jgi:hypothetical protein
MWVQSPTCSTRAALFLCCILVALVSGCSGKKLHPVSGVVTVGDKPLNTGAVRFVPDKSKGNTSTAEPAGSIDETGHYTISTLNKPGAQAGWYKVVIRASAKIDSTEASTTPTHWLIDEQYRDADHTPLEVEVVPNPQPGHYNLKAESTEG